MITLSPSLEAPRWLQSSVGECTITNFRCSTEPMHHIHLTSIRPMLLSHPVRVCTVRSKFDGSSRIRPQGIPSLRSGNNKNINFQVGDSYLSPSERRKMDEHDDSRFYERPRFVEHSDDDFLYRLRSLVPLRYKDHLAPGMRVLDLMASWQSHLPDGISFRRVTGVGMNAAELLANSSLNEFTVQNLNAEPVLPFGDAAFDAVICNVSVQNLQHPEQVFAEVERVLSSSGLFVVTYSQASYPDKAVAGWLSRNLSQRLALVSRLLQHSNFEIHSSHSPPPLKNGDAISLGDPFCFVVAKKGQCSPDDVAYRYDSTAVDTLKEVEEAGVLQMWVAAFREMQAEAEGLGIPRRALPDINEPICGDSIREARDSLRAIIESRMSSNL